MTDVTVAHIFISVGLVLDIFGAGLLSLGLIMPQKSEAVRLSGITGMAYSMDKPPSDETMLKQPAVRDRLLQSRRAEWGFPLLFFGSVLQLIGTWLA
jgi:hypothetical protein